MKKKINLIVFKERNFGPTLGEIQFWDESEDKLERVISLSSPFSDIKHSIEGKHIGQLKFNSNISKEEAKEYFNAIKKALNGIEKSKSWIESN